MKMDEKNPDKMIACVNAEKSGEAYKKSEEAYYDKIIDMAALTLSRLSLNDVRVDEDYLNMMKAIANNMIERGEYKLCMKVIKGM